MTDTEARQLLVQEWNKWTDGPKVFHTGQLVMDWGTGQIEVAVRAILRAANADPGDGSYAK